MIIKCIYKKPVWTADPEKNWHENEQMKVDDVIGNNLIATKKFIEIKSIKKIKEK